MCITCDAAAFESWTSGGTALPAGSSISPAGFCILLLVAAVDDAAAALDFSTSTGTAVRVVASCLPDPDALEEEDWSG